MLSLEIILIIIFDISIAPWVDIGQEMVLELFQFPVPGHR